MALSITKLHHLAGNLSPKQVTPLQEPLAEEMFSALYTPYSSRLL